MRQDSTKQKRTRNISELEYSHHNLEGLMTNLPHDVDFYIIIIFNTKKLVNISILFLTSVNLVTAS